MRIAECIKPLNIMLRGTAPESSKVKPASVHITEGWKGDLDQVIGVNDEGVSETVLDQLGPHGTADNFRLADGGELHPVSDAIVEPSHVDPNPDSQE